MTAPPPATPVPTRRVLPLERADLQLAGLTLVTGILVLALGVFAHNVLQHGAMTSGIDLLQVWNRWDAPHYQDLAVLGYRATDPGVLTIDGYQRAYPGDLPLYIVFFPLYPWLVGAVTWALRDPLVSAFIVSGIAAFFVAPLLYRLVRVDFGHEVGMRAAWFVLIFPTAYFLHIGYTESLFLALVLGSFLAARTDHWWLAGILGGLACLARINGLVLIPTLAAEAWYGWQADPQRRIRWEWVAIGLVGVGFAGYLALNWGVYGNPLEFLRIQHEHWYKQLQWPWVGIGGLFATIGSGTESALINGWMELAFTILGLAGTIYAAFRFRTSWFVWMAGNWLLFTSTGYVMSVPRYSITLFPIFAWLALETRPVDRAISVSLISLAGFVWFASLFAQGQWAF